MVYEWQAYQQTCFQLYIQEGKSLEEIMAHMKRAYNFAPSRRAYQTQFRRWNFPSKQNPAYKNERLVKRVRELWEKNFTQREMLHVLNEQEGFSIKPRELIRLRSRNRLLLRASMDEKAAEMATRQTSPDVTGSPATGQGQANTDTRPSTPSTASEQASNSMLDQQDGISTRYPSQMKLEDACGILHLDNASYRQLRSDFEQICVDEDLLRKTLAGPVRWATAKSRLLHSRPQLADLLAQDDEGADAESRGLALDIVCLDVTKRLREEQGRMTLTEANNLLGLNPHQSRELRATLRQVFRQTAFKRKSDASREQWAALKRRCAEKSEAFRKVLDDEAAAPSMSPSKKSQALELLVQEEMKRTRRGRGHERTKLVTGAGSTVQADLSIRSISDTDNELASMPSQMGLEDEVAETSFDDSLEVSPTPQLAFEHGNGALVTQTPEAVTEPGRHMGRIIAQPCGGRSIEASIRPNNMAIGSQMSPSLLMADNAPAAFPGGSYTTQQQYSTRAMATTSATTTPVYTTARMAAPSPAPAQTAAAPPPPPLPPLAVAAYMRLTPSSNFVAGPGMWIAMLHSHTVQELRQVAVASFPGAVCLRVEGMVKDGRGGGIPLPIQDDAELGAYLAHVQGQAPTFNVQLWKTA